jgi:type 2 lantibiotic biosynthesis protein LanM
MAIVERASSLSERLNGHFIPTSQGDQDSSIEARLMKWSRTVAAGNPGYFDIRLGWDNLETEKITEILGDVRLANPEFMPSWTGLLKELIEAEPTEDTARILDPENPLPFEDIYLPFVQVARQKLLDRVGENWQIFSEAVQQQIGRQLLQKLHRLMTSSLYIEISLWKALKNPTFSLSSDRFQEDGEDRQYRLFVEEMRSGKLIAFFRKYSVLARLMAVSIELWIDEKAEFIGRLASDLPILESAFHTCLGPVVAIRLDLSEPHNRRRSVLAVTFSQGLTLVYKPRTVELEQNYFQLLAWCNQQPDLLPSRLLTVVDRQTHGWMEFVEQIPCPSVDAACRYYERAGMLLCLLYVLQGNDCHEENLIANGEHPVLIDLETLLHPRVRESEPENESDALPEDPFVDSVLGCGLLPQWELVGEDGQVEDVSGLGGGGESPIAMRRLIWEKVNQDTMRPTYQEETPKCQQNTLWLDDRKVCPGEYTEELVTGFEKMYRCLLENRAALLAPDGLLTLFAGRSNRFLFRPSDVYGQLLMRTIHPKLLQQGIDRSIELESLARVFLALSEKPAHWSIFTAEITALERMDVPFFTANSSSDALSVEEGEDVPHFFREASYDRVRARLEQLDEENLTLQSELIRGALYSSQASGMITLTGENVEDGEPEEMSFTPAEAIEMAKNIALTLQTRGRRGATGQVNWIGLTYLPKARRYQLQPLGDNLYDGNHGIALFLAALARITGEGEWRQLALDAVRDSLDRYRTLDPAIASRLVSEIGIGAGSGVGSIIYCLAQMARFLDEPDLATVAGQLARVLTPEAIALDRSFDLISGTAGAIISLLALHGVENDDSLVERAIHCGDHLLASRVIGRCGWRAWPVINGELTTGLSHGAAGIALALLRLYGVSGEERFLDGAREAIAFEDSLLDLRRHNWQDLESAPEFLSSWCHGAPGIGLARIGGLSLLDTAEIRRDIESALKTTLDTGLPPIDHLCCGNFGRIETLLVASERLARPDLGAIAYQQAGRRVALARRRGNFALTGGVNNAIDVPGFFQGMAGIGYQLLRLGTPHRIPSVLLWE